jgi:MPBQ/MSBQ methyltransferase
MFDISHNGINQHYDRVMFTPSARRAYGGTDYWNYGYRLPHVRSQAEACRALMRKLVQMIARPQGNILDVACGKGATSQYLTRHYAPHMITGINISPKQLAVCRANVPGATFLMMDAAKMTFPDASFDNIICVEAAFDFRFREQFLRHALRVLKPGGSLVITDILRDRCGHDTVFFPAENYVPDPSAYRTLCENIGFQSVHVENATLECFTRFATHRLGEAKQKLLQGAFTAEEFDAATRQLIYRLWVVRYYLLASMVKAA